MRELYARWSLMSRMAHLPGDLFSFFCKFSFVFYFYIGLGVFWDFFFLILSMELEREFYLRSYCSYHGLPRTTDNYYYDYRLTISCMETCLYRRTVCLCHACADMNHSSNAVRCQIQLITVAMIFDFSTGITSFLTLVPYCPYCSTASD